MHGKQGHADNNRELLRLDNGASYMDLNFNGLMEFSGLRVEIASPRCVLGLL